MVVLAVLALALIGILGAPAAASAAGAWSAQTSGVTSLLYGVSFPNQSQGWAVGVGGVILTTGDSGETWTPQVSGTATDLWECWFVNATHGWACGVNGLMLATTDGGATWTPQATGATANLEDVGFVDETHGWAVGTYGAIVATTDGGAHWTPQTSGISGWLYDITWTDRVHAWTCSDNGVILATANGGATWAPQTSGTTAALRGIQFTDASHGWAYGNNGTIIATTDGGANWTPQVSGGTSEFWRSAAFVGGRLWVVGMSGAVVATTDGGANWAPQDPGTTASLWDVSFPITGRGWAVGASGTIVVYKEDFDITVSSTGQGTVTPATGPVAGGSSPKYTFAPSAGYEVGDVVVDGVSVGAPLSYTFNDVQAAHTLAVTFVAMSDNMPTTTVKGLKSGWSKRPVKLRFTGHPSVLYPIPLARTEYRVQGGEWTTGTAVKISHQGATRVSYRSVDVQGNVETPAKVCTVRVDSRAPRVLARPAAGPSGSEAWLKYRVKDPIPGCGRALVRLVVVDASGHALTRSSTLPTRTNVWHTVRISTASLAPDTYTVVLRAMDAAGNFQHGVTRTTLTVR